MIDPVFVQVLRSHLESLVEEMQHHVFRSGYSTIVRESRDFSCAVLDAEGRLMVAPTMFFHAPIYAAFARRLRDVYGEEGLREGDIFLSNHPYEGGMPHVPDMGILAPVRHEGKLVGFVGSVAHKADVGGAVPGSANGQATELFQEGLLLPPVRLYDQGLLCEDLRRILEANSRTPGLVWGDLTAQVGVVRLGEERIRRLSAKHGIEAVTAAFGRSCERGRELRSALSHWAEGRVEVEGEMDHDGVDLDRPVAFRVGIEVADGRIRFDFTESDPQAVGPVNLRGPLVEACCFHALIGVVDPGMRYNDGMKEAVQIVLRPGTVASALPPAPVSNYMMACHKLVDVILEGLSLLRPERAVAHGGEAEVR